MLSRVANSLFWMSRYVERAECVARFIDANQALMLTSTPGANAQWEPIVYASGDEEPFQERYDSFTAWNVLSFLTFDLENPNSILACIQQARENARTVREHLSKALWEELNIFYHEVRSGVKQLNLGNADQFFQMVRRSAQSIIGITESTMSQGEGWNFCRMGRLLERADKSSRILDVKYYTLLPQVSDVGSSSDIVQWSALLESNSALQMYRRRYGRIVPNNVVDFLVLDRFFPRSIHFCLLKAEESLHHITGSGSGTFQNRAEQLLGQLRSSLNFLTVDDVIAGGLHEFIDDLQQKLNAVGEAIHDVFFEFHPEQPKSSWNQSQSQRGQSQSQSMG